MDNYYLVDSHAHLTLSERPLDVEAVVGRAEKARVQQIINVCTDVRSLEKGLLLGKRHPWIYNAGAIAPQDAAVEKNADFEAIAEAARSGHLVAIGETGLDYYYGLAQADLQKDFLRRHLQLAAECRLPAMFHCRQAFEDLFAITDAEYPKGAAAIVHCFTGTTEEAKQALDRGWLLSFSGIVTFKNGGPLREIAKWIPLDSMLIETDAPFLAPQSKRGFPNEPAFIVETAVCIADARGIPLEELAQATTANARKVFGLFPK